MKDRPEDCVLTQQEVADAMGISRQRVAIIEQQAFRKLRRLRIVKEIAEVETMTRQRRQA